MNHPGPQSQVRVSIAGTCCAVALLTAGIASAQNPSPPSDDPAAAAPAARSMVGPGQMPHVPKALSRPEGWPGRTGGAKAGVDNHVLSSILANPGGPLEPIAAPIDAAGVEAGRKSAVIQAGFEETLPSGTAASGQPAAMQSLDNARVVARVGPEVVLEGDLLTPSALAWLDKVSGGLTPEQIRELKTQICRQVIKQHVESLIVYVDACRTIPEDRLPEIEKKVNEAFDQQQLPRLVKDAGVANALEYDQLLRSRGQSLDRIRKTFFERALAQQWVQQKVVDDGEIPHAEMIAWYQNHLADYEYPAKVRFEQLSVKISASRPRGQAWSLLAAMGNDVMQGKPFADVARSRSEGPTASTGGAYDWTTKGSLVSKVVDEAVFTLPVGQLSAILEDGSALHIVRVIERTEAGRTPFIEAQVEIRSTLEDERRKREMEEYLTVIRERTPVWTIFDDDPAGGAAQPAAQTASQPRKTR
jgi:parvulin-like peptidyl-prolyl isomerase